MDIVDGKYLFPKIICRQCQDDINNGTYIFMAWNRSFCSKRCRNEYNIRSRSKSFLEQLNEYFKYICNC